MLGRCFELLRNKAQETTRGIGTVAVYELPSDDVISKPEHVVLKRDLRHPAQLTGSLDYVLAETGLHLLVGPTCEDIMRPLFVQIACVVSPICFRRYEHRIRRGAPGSKTTELIPHYGPGSFTRIRRARRRPRFLTVAALWNCQFCEIKEAKPICPRCNF